MKVVKFLRVFLRDAHVDTWARVTTAGTLGAVALGIAGFEATDTVRALMAWWGASAGIYGAILMASAPADPDPSNA